jgi:hypothetical protein
VFVDQRYQRDRNIELFYISGEAVEGTLRCRVKNGIAPQCGEALVLISWNWWGYRAETPELAM